MNYNGGKIYYILKNSLNNNLLKIIQNYNLINILNVKFNKYIIELNMTFILSKTSYNKRCNKYYLNLNNYNKHFNNYQQNLNNIKGCNKYYLNYFSTYNEIYKQQFNLKYINL